MSRKDNNQLTKKLLVFLLLFIGIGLLVMACKKMNNHASTQQNTSYTPQVAATLSSGLSENNKVCASSKNIPFPDKGLQNTHILYMAQEEDTSREQLWSINLGDGSQTLLANTTYPVSKCCSIFLSDGNTFVLKQPGNPDKAIWLSDLQGSHLKKTELTESILSDFPRYSISWSILAYGSDPSANDYWKGRVHSPDGKKIAIWIPDDPALIIQDESKGEKIQVMKIPKGGFVNGGWSPDGTRFAFAYQSDTYGTQSQLYGVNSDGTGLQPISQLFADSPITNLVWSPDGQKLAFWMWDRNKNWPNPSIGVLTLATQEMKFLAVGTPKAQSYMENGYIVWSPNSKWVAFFTLWEQVDIGVVNIEDNQMYCLTNDANIESMMDWR